MMEKRKIEDLPNELLTEIISNIPHQSQLAKVALLSKRFRALVEPLLYRNIDLDIRCTAEELRDTGIVNGHLDQMAPSFERFDRLIHTVGQRQNLGKKVLTLSLKINHRLWYQNLAPHFRLLQQLPQLRALSLSPPPFPLVIPDLNCALTSVRLDFSHATNHYRGINGWEHYTIPLGIVAKQLWLPGLRKLQVDEMHYVEHFEYRHHFPGEKFGSSSITDLRLLGCSMAMDPYEDLMAAILRSIKCLKRFVIEISSPHWGVTRAPGSNVFEHGLWQHKDTLEELAVAMSQAPYMMKWALGPFTQWSSLRRLAVPGFMIPTTADLHEILPPSLEAFQIEHPFAPIHLLEEEFRSSPLLASWNAIYNSTAEATQRNSLATLHRLADNKGSSMPRLRHVVWWWQEPPGCEPDDPALLDLASAFEMTPIKFEFVSGLYFKDTPFGKGLCEWQE